jgi:hypothetical protein
VIEHTTCTLIVPGIYIEHLIPIEYRWRYLDGHMLGTSQTHAQEGVTVVHVPWTNSYYADAGDTSAILQACRECEAKLREIGFPLTGPGALTARNQTKLPYEARLPSWIQAHRSWQGQGSPRLELEALECLMPIPCTT